ncbi:MAG: hypothetical protein F6K35_22955 [Okeania sp. SIO2H7]|nr:hypothetical protein [Okeania sp. SIO2H7]
MWSGNFGESREGYFSARLRRSLEKIEFLYRASQNENPCSFWIIDGNNREEINFIIRYLVV